MDASIDEDFFRAGTLVVIILSAGLGRNPFTSTGTSWFKTDRQPSEL